jgi:hypothetical protein
MTDINKTLQQHKQLCSMVSEKKVKQSLDILSDMMKNVSAGDFRDEYDNLVMTYRNMLTYTIEGINDPERSKVYLKLIQSILELSDKVYCHIIPAGIPIGLNNRQKKNKNLLERQ